MRGGRHFDKKDKSSLWLQIAVLAVISAALLFVLCRLYPNTLPAPLVKLSDEAVSAAVVRSGDKTTQTAKTAEKLPSAAAVPAKSADKHAQIDKKTGKSEKSGKPVITAKGGTIAIVVDDGGEQLNLTKRVAALKIPLTFAIMPYRKYSEETAKIATEHGRPYLLHLPMQAEIDKDSDTGEFLIGIKTPKDKIAEITAKALDSLPDPIGLNNHRGSRATADASVMSPVMQELKERGLIYLDSRTSLHSVAYSEAKKAGVTAFKNGGFLDHTADLSQIKARFNEAAKRSAAKGPIVVICHFRPVTVKFLEQLDKEYPKMSTRLTTLPELANR